MLTLTVLIFLPCRDNPEQRRRPPDDNFQLFTMEEWFGMSSTHKILTGSLQCPLPHEIEPSGKIWKVFSSYIPPTTLVYSVY